MIIVLLISLPLSSGLHIRDLVIPYRSPRFPTNVESRSTSCMLSLMDSMHTNERIGKRLSCYKCSHTARNPFVGSLESSYRLRSSLRTSRSVSDDPAQSTQSKQPSENNPHKFCESVLSFSSRRFPFPSLSFARTFLFSFLFSVALNPAYLRSPAPRFRIR